MTSKAPGSNERESNRETADEKHGTGLNDVEGQMVGETKKSIPAENEGADVAAPEIQYLVGLKLWLVLIALLLAMFLVALDMVNPILL